MQWAILHLLHKVKVKVLVAQSCLNLCGPMGYAADQAPLSLGFSRQEHWSGLPFPSPGDLLDPGIKPRSPTLQAYSLLSEPSSNPPFTLPYTVMRYLTLLNIYIQSLKLFSSWFLYMRWTDFSFSCSETLLCQFYWCWILFLYFTCEKNSWWMLVLYPAHFFLSFYFHLTSFSSCLS